MNLVRHLVDRGEETLLLDNRPLQAAPFLVSYWDNEVKGVTGDLLDLPFLFSVIKEYSIESIIHAAAIFEGSGTLYRVLKVNLEGTTNVLEAGRIFNLRRITFISSSTVYQGAKNALRFYEDLDLPVTSEGFISATKKAGEQICLLYAREYGLSLPIVRLARVYGPLSHRGLNPVEIMAENAVANKPTDLSETYGGSKSNHIYVKDCVKGISLIHCAKVLKHNIYNLGDGTPHSLSDFAEAVREVIPNAKIHLGTTRPRIDLDLPPLDIDRVKGEVGFVPDYSLKQAVRDYIEWVRDKKY